MTCIAARVTGIGPRLRVRWAWESRTSLEDGGLFVAESVPKVQLVPGWGPVGGAGDSGSLLEGFDVFRATGDLTRLCALIKSLKLEEAYDAEWLVWRDGLCLIDRRGVLTQPATTYWACGMAWQVALGAMAAGASALRAVRIACELHASCGGPVHALEWRPGA